ncbi:hypothetical protein L6452_01772 [Arctium lappa]|uniref:Uncharacterized protein n=1 Tax=Arctium lappa TaxID=4217 RepID=A0ACB9FHT0_ARCLA|nr:hypothetical protein L6452_01772 [Arctium lappa]
MLVSSSSTSTSSASSFTKLQHKVNVLNKFKDDLSTIITESRFPVTTSTSTTYVNNSDLQNFKQAILKKLQTPTPVSISINEELLSNKLETIQSSLDDTLDGAQNSQASKEETSCSGFVYN